MSMKSFKNGKTTRKALGRGLSALISPQLAPNTQKEQAATREQRAPADPQSGAASLRNALFPSKEIPPPRTPSSLHRVVPLANLAPNPFQPRRRFDESDLRELADSIKSHGVLQPVIVRPPRTPDEQRYEIVAGERRWRAARLAGLAQIPVIVKEVSDKDALEAALIENIQRSNLNPIEEARAYESLATEFSLSQQQIAERVGKDRATVANMLRLLKLPDQVITLISEGKLSMGHAKAILTVKEPGAQLSLAKRCVDEGLSVRAVEDIVSRVVVLDSARKAPGRTQSAPPGPPFIADCTAKLRNALGTKVTISHQKTGKGRITVDYFSEQELERIIDLICNHPR